MRKTKYLILLFVVLVLKGMSQYSFYPSKTIHIYQNFNELDYDSIHIENNSTDTLQLKWKRILNDTSEGTFFDFCASGNCFIGVPDSGSFPPIPPHGFGYSGSHLWTGNTETVSILKLLVYTDTKNAGDTLTYFLHSVHSAAIETSGVDDFVLSPNPANEAVTVRLKGQNSEQVQLEIIDCQQKVIVQQSLENGINTIQTAELHSGIYFLKIFTTGKIVFKKIIIRH